MSIVAQLSLFCQGSVSVLLCDVGMLADWLWRRYSTRVNFAELTCIRVGKTGLQSVQSGSSSSNSDQATASFISLAHYVKDLLFKYRCIRSVHRATTCIYECVFALMGVLSKHWSKCRCECLKAASIKLQRQQQQQQLDCSSNSTKGRCRNSKYSAVLYPSPLGCFWTLAVVNVRGSESVQVKRFSPR